MEQTHPNVDTARSFCRKIMRRPCYSNIYKKPPSSDPNSSPTTLGDLRIPPRTPSSSWLGLTWVQMGICITAAPPSEADLRSPRSGRVFTINAKDPLPVAIYPSCPDNPHVPPFPGERPGALDLWGQAEGAFDDGSLGCWDPRFIPQLWDPKRPWWGFFVCPLSFRDGATPEFWLVTSLFRWNFPQVPLQGGQWIHSKLREVFAFRDTIEERIRVQLQSMPWVDLGLYTLPWFDPLTLDRALQFGTWREGREWLGRTLMYIAELKAMSRWLVAVERKHAAKLARQWPPRERNPADPGLMGVWAQTITSTEEWHTLMHARVPIYILMRLEPSHLLSQVAKPGELSGDEHLRHGNFSASLNRPNCFLRIRFYIGPHTKLNLHSPTSLIPSSLQFPPAPQLPADVSSLAPYLSWKSYPWQDTTVFRGRVTVNPSIVAAVHQEDPHFAWLPPDVTLLSPTLDSHPLLSVVPQSKDLGMTYYVEEWDGDKGYWPIRIGKKKKKEAEKLPYRFDFERKRITFFSLHPFPGRSRSFGRVIQDFDDEDHTTHANEETIDNSERFYYRQPLSETDSAQYPTADFIWNPPNVAPEEATNELVRQIADFHIVSDNVWPVGTELNQPVWITGANRFSTARKLEEMKEAAQSSTADDAAIVTIDNGTAREDNSFENPQLTQTDETLTQQRIETLSGQRQLLSEQLARRFFYPKYGVEWESSTVVPWSIYCAEGRQTIRCFPIRIANIPGSNEMSSILPALLETSNVADFLVASSYYELDTTLTVNVGLRYPEDALAMWGILSGIKCESRPLEVYPVKAILGSITVYSQPFRPSRSRYMRLEVVDTIIAREQRFKGSAKNSQLIQSAEALARCLQNASNRYFPPAITSSSSSSSSSAAPFLSSSLPGSTTIAPQYLPTLDLDVKYPPPLKCNWGFGYGKHADPRRPHDGDMCKIQLNEPQNISVPSQPKKNPHFKPTTRHKGHARDAAANSNPTAARSMNARERHNKQRAWELKSEELRTCWKENLILPRYIAPLDHSNQSATFRSCYKALWLFHKQCELNLAEQRDSLAREYDLSVFYDAFDSLIDLEGIYGEDYADLDNLRKTLDWHAYADLVHNVNEDDGARND